MPILGIFETTAEKLEKERKRRRECERGVEKGILILSDAEKKATINQEKYYQDGKKLLQVGRKVEARTQFQYARMQMAQQQNYVRMRLMWDNALTQIRISSSMQKASACFQDLVKMSGLQVSKIEDSLNSMEDVQDFMADINNAFSAQWNQQNSTAGNSSDSDVDPGIEAMMEQAEREIAAELGGATPSKTASNTPF